MKIKTMEMVVSGILAGVLAIFSMIYIPVGAVPITLASFGVVIVSIIEKPKWSVVSVIIYILIGAVGLPVFSGLKGGLGVLIGPTGGYILAYPIISYIVSKASEKTGMLQLYFWVIISLLTCYIMGITQYIIITGVSVKNALIICVYPFIIPDILKVVTAVVTGRKIKARIKL